MFRDKFDVVLHDASDFLFGAPDKDELSKAASESGPVPSDMEYLAGLPPSGAVAQSEYDAEYDLLSTLGWMIVIWAPSMTHSHAPPLCLSS